MDLSENYHLDQNRIEAIGDDINGLSESQKLDLAQMTIRKINDTREAALKLLFQEQAQNLAEAWEQVTTSL